MTSKFAFALIASTLAFSVACGEEKTDDTQIEDPGCEVGIDETIPADGATDAYYRADIEFQLDDPDESSPTITLSQGGTDVPGSTWLNDDMDVVYFTPTAPLAPSTSYTATLSYCSGTPSINFTTSALGAELTADVVSQTYVIDLATARFVEPAGVGELIGEFVTMNVLVGVTEVSGSEITMMGALSVEGGTEQDFCTPTFDFPAADFSETPYFVVSADEITLSVAGYDIPLKDLEVSGTFASDGTYFGGAVLGGTVDARDIVEMIDEVDTWEDACALTASFGAPCVACDDSVEACLTLLADQIVAEQNPGQVLEVVGEDDPRCKE
ncbi:MAG: Ig-like domain-containing protein [Pseudomonadota bacterium]